MNRACLLDTYVVVNLRTAEEFGRLPTPVRRMLDAPQTQLFLSAISQMEIAVKHSIGKLKFPSHELAAVCSNAGIEFLPFEEHHARQMYDLPLVHKDPFDRALIATAIVEGLSFLSPDRALAKYEGLDVVWG